MTTYSLWLNGTDYQHLTNAIEFLNDFNQDEPQITFEALPVNDTMTKVTIAVDCMEVAHHIGTRMCVNQMKQFINDNPFTNL